ncbi:MAG TPA: endonuclease domain-containing protein, partial [Bacteroidota bacterium]|nr:endonuclease domain-containing protein [Bacteroidota bacterium]
KGYTFNRQRPVLDYITDFLCKKLRLVIEVDGITHQYEETYLKDKIKEEELEKAGFTVVRFLDEEVLKDIENVRRAIDHCVEEREKELGITSPLSPSQRGENISCFNSPKGVSLSSCINSKRIETLKIFFIKENFQVLRHA